MTKNVVIYGVLTAIVVFGLMWGRVSAPAAEHWGETQVACLPNGHQQLELHIHPRIEITVDGVPERVPGNIGITPTCMAEVHTHDASGEIHVETVDASRAGRFTLADFFAVWGMSYEREGFTASVTLDGAPVSGPESVPLRDGDKIGVSYASSSAGAE